MAHPITGRTTLTINGELRTLACDMNCAAALFEAKGEAWQQWLIEHFLGEAVEGGRRVTPLSPVDTITALYALLATDREDSPRVETEKTLRRGLGLPDLADIQLALIKSVLAGFGLPGEFIEAVANAADAPPAKRAANQVGAGTTR